MKQEAARAGGSGRELRVRSLSFLQADYTITSRSTPGGLGSLGSSRQTDSRSYPLLPQVPPLSAAGAATQMLHCYSGKWIAARNLYTKADRVEEEEEEVEQVRSLLSFYS